MPESIYVLTPLEDFTKNHYIFQFNINKKVYIAKHSTEKTYDKDTYTGSGAILLRYKRMFGEAAKKKLLKCRVVIETLWTEYEAYQREKEIVTKEFINQKHVLNKTTGGSGWRVKKAKEAASLADLTDYWSKEENHDKHSQMCLDLWKTRDEEYRKNYGQSIKNGQKEYNKVRPALTKEGWRQKFQDMLNKYNVKYITKRDDPRTYSFYLRTIKGGQNIFPEEWLLPDIGYSIFYSSMGKYPGKGQVPIFNGNQYVWQRVKRGYFKPFRRT